MILYVLLYLYLCPCKTRSVSTGDPVCPAVSISLSLCCSLLYTEGERLRKGLEDQTNLQRERERERGGGGGRRTDGRTGRQAGMQAGRQTDGQ